jgi:NO-binding membrane sensor protein with MHYT domain
MQLILNEHFLVPLRMKLKRHFRLRNGRIHWLCALSSVLAARNICLMHFNALPKLSSINNAMVLEAIQPGQTTRARAD